MQLFEIIIITLLNYPVSPYTMFLKVALRRCFLKLLKLLNSFTQKQGSFPGRTGTGNSIAVSVPTCTFEVKILERKAPCVGEVSCPLFLLYCCRVYLLTRVKTNLEFLYGFAFKMFYIIQTLKWGQGPWTGKWTLKFCLSSSLIISRFYYCYRESW